MLNPMTPSGRWSASMRPRPVQEFDPRKHVRDRRGARTTGYRRQGTRNLFLTCEPLRGWRHEAITQQRTQRDFVYQMRWLVDEAYPEAQVVRVLPSRPTGAGFSGRGLPVPDCRPGR